MTDIPELTAAQLARAIPARVRKRLMQGRFESGDDVSALRRFVGLTQARFARAMGISVHTLRNWEQGRRTPEGPAIALLRIAARHPRILRENLRTAAWQHGSQSNEVAFSVGDTPPRQRRVQPGGNPPR
jgi:putative transcriptional regulator